jgi:NAD-dependent deacetylase
MSSKDESDLASVNAALAKARRVLVLTGAGISAESGVPTFSGGGGTSVWRGMPFETLSSVQTVEKDLPLVWEWFDYRRSVLAECQPNAAHRTLAECESSKRFDEFTIVTQNVDGLHAAAGSTNIIELHGNVWRARCLKCTVRRDIRDVPIDERPPICIVCGEMMRPDVVLFGENLPAGAFELGEERAMNCDVCLVIGTSALVYPAARLPEIALEAGKFVVEVNPEVTAFSRHCDVSLRGLAGEIVPELLTA